MKNTLPLVILAIAFAFSSRINSQIIYFEDFGGSYTNDVGPPYNGSPNPYGPTSGGPGTWTFAPGWFLRNVDNLTPAASVAYVNEAWEIREDFGINVTNACAFSTSWYNPIGTANDWMWTTLIGPITTNCVLTWLGRAYDPSYPDGYEVRIMTSSQGPPTGGTGTIGNQITNSTVIFSTAAEGTGTWQSHNVSLAAYAGQSIYIGFRNNSVDKFLLVIDDVKVENILNYDANLTSINNITEYTQIPLCQVSPLPINGTISNPGLNSITNVGLHVQVFDPGMTNIYDATGPTVASISPGGNSGLLNAGTWTPPAIPGTYTVKIFPELTETDEQPLNDTLITYLVVSDSTYSRDDTVSTGSLGIGAGTGGFMGNEFQITTAARLASVNVHFNGGTPGEPMAAVVWDMSGGIPNAIVAFTDTITYTTTGPMDYTIPMYGGDYSITPGAYAITMIEFDSTLQIALATNNYFPNRTWINWPGNPFGTWANNEDFGSQFAKIYMIRAILKPFCPADIITGVTPTNAGCGLADGTATVTTIGAGPFIYDWSSGGTTATETGLAVGTYYVTVTDQYSGCSEVDTVDIVNPNAPSSSISASSDESCAGCNDGSATVLASGGTPGYTYSWAPSGGTAATANGLAPGTYTVTVTDAANCSSTSTVTINSFNGIEDVVGLFNANVFPNPNHGSFSITGEFNYTGEMQIEVLTILGQSVFSKVITVENQITTNLNLTLAPGTYILRLKAGDIVHSRQLIIK